MPPDFALRGRACFWGAHTSFRFYSVALGSPTLEFEARPPGVEDDQSQSVSIQINDVQVSMQRLEAGWAEYQVALPAEHVRVGWNRLDMGFRFTPR